MNRKKRGQRIHVKKRASERFGISLNRDNIKDLVHMIQKQLGTFVMKISGSKTSWVLSYKQNKFYVAYDKNTKNIATVMPLEYAVSDLLKETEKDLKVWEGFPNTLVYAYPEDFDKIEHNITLASDLLKERLKENATSK